MRTTAGSSKTENMNIIAPPRYPDKKMVILSCMDTRLIELLPKAMNLKNGDAKIVKNAGAIVTQPFGNVMRSILVALYKLKAEGSVRHRSPRLRHDRIKCG